MKRFHKFLGKEGERHAENYLRRLGYLFVCRNYSCKRGEIDLVFLDGEDLVFAEVKTMSEKTEAFYGAPGEKVTRQKQEHLTLAAAHFLAKHPKLSAEHYPRFDVLEVTFRASGPVVFHTKNAFEARCGFVRKKLF